MPDLADRHDALERASKSGRISQSIEVPSGFGRDVIRDWPTKSVAAWLDGAMPFRAETIEGYLFGLHQSYLDGLATRQPNAAAPDGSGGGETRPRYNQDFRGIYAMVPSTIALLLVFIPAILMALGIVREKELGSIVNLYVTPVRGIEILLGKQLPRRRAGDSRIISRLRGHGRPMPFGVPLKGSVAALTLGAPLRDRDHRHRAARVCLHEDADRGACSAQPSSPRCRPRNFPACWSPRRRCRAAWRFSARCSPRTSCRSASARSPNPCISAQLLPSLLALAAFIPVLTALNLFFLPEQDR